jgi:signal transduction histidine kinase
MMSPRDNIPPTPSARALFAPAQTPESGPQLAHELANLLDGSLRNVSLVLSSLRAPAHGDPLTIPLDDDLLARLETVSIGLRQMATLIHRWMGRQHEAAWQHQDTRTLRQVIDHATRLLQPAATSRRVTILVTVTEPAGNLPAAGVYPILANALRNGIEAIAGDTHRNADGTSGGGGTVQVGAAIIAGALQLTIADDGPGLAPTLFDEAGQFRFGITSKPNGHGLGLSLCRDIAARLGGTLTLTNRVPRGTVLRVCLPVSPSPDCGPQPLGTQTDAGLPGGETI